MCAKTSTKENITQTNNYSVSEKGLSEETNREMVWRHHIVSLLPRGNHRLCPKTSNNRAHPIISDKAITTPVSYSRKQRRKTSIPIGKQHVLLHIRAVLLSSWNEIFVCGGTSLQIGFWMNLNLNEFKLRLVK